MSFQVLREKLMQPPTELSFAELCVLFETWDGSDIMLGIDYAEKHLDSWKDEFRHVENINWDKKLPLWWPLVRSYRHSVGQKLPDRWKKSPELLQHLNRLMYVRSEHLKSLDDFSQFTGLTALHFYSCGTLRDISGLSNLTGLTELHLGDSYALKKLDGLSSLRHLTTLDMRHCRGLKQIDALASLDNLTTLNLTSCRSLEDVYGLANLPNLRRLRLWSCGALKVKPKVDDMETREEVEVYQEKVRKHSKNITR